MQRVVVLICLLILAVGWATWTMRAASAGHELGHLPRTSVQATIAALRRDPRAFSGKTVALTGRMTDRCPTAGCWFYLNDGTGDLRVDARDGGFSVLGLPVGARLTVFGTVVREPGQEPELAAVGARS
jgi:hypothetical protein